MSEINELSPETYASYIKKASADMAAKAEGPSSMRTPKKIRQDADLAAKDKKTLPLGRDGAEQRKRHDLLTRHAVARRKKGIENATDRLVAKTKAATSPSSDVKVKNPDTGEEILATTAYKAGPTHPAYKAAKSALKKESTGIIKLTDIILENYIDEYSDEEKQKMGIPSGATSRGGVWYVGDKYAGKVVNGKFVAAVKTQSAGKKPPKDKTKAKVSTTLPSFKKFKDNMLGAGRSVTKQEWHRELDRVVVSAYEKQNPPTKLPPEAVSTTEEEKQDFESRLKKLGLGDVAAPPRSSSGIVNPKFMKAMIDHQKQFPYSREIGNRFGGAGGENPTWMPRVYT